MLDVGDGNLVYWETCGNPRGKPALVVHGGPGSGCSDWHRRLFAPGQYRVVLFDQRNCGRSAPHASDPAVDLTCNTTWKLVADMEALRRHLQVDRWLVLGGSWGSTLALTYAKQHPQRVSEMILFGVTTGRHAEFDWLFRGGVAVFFPGQWARLRSYLPATGSDRDIVEGYHTTCCTIRTLGCGSERPSSGAHGSPRPSLGRRPPGWRGGSATPGMRLRSPASLRTTYGTTHGWRTAVCWTVRTRWRISRAYW